VDAPLNQVQKPYGVVFSVLYKVFQRLPTHPPTVVIVTTTPAMIRPTTTEYSSNDAPLSSFQKRTTEHLMLRNMKPFSGYL